METPYKKLKLNTGYTGAGRRGVGLRTVMEKLLIGGDLLHNDANVFHVTGLYNCEWFLSG